MAASMLACVALAVTASCAAVRPGAVAARPGLPDFPDVRGVAGAFAGTVDGWLLAAGGANFPGPMPWVGGRKVWYDRVFALPLDTSAAGWREVGRLPVPNAYGVSLTTPDGVLVIGGGDADRHFTDVWTMRLEADRVVLQPLPPLPRPLAQMAGALVGREVHVVGGIEDPRATHASAAHWMLDLDHPSAGWHSLPPLPGESRILATAAAIDGALFVFGGCSLAPDANGAPRTYLRDAWRFSRGEWMRLADLPHPLAAAAMPAPVEGRSAFLLGGDDGSQVTVPPADHRGFAREILRYDASANSWTSAGALAFPAPVTVPTAPWHDQFILVSGEVRPGVRTPRVVLFRPSDGAAR